MNIVPITSKAPVSVEWGITSPGEVFTSDLNGKNQTAALPGSKWTGSVIYPPLFGRDARDYTAFAGMLKGMANVFRIVPHGQRNKGLARVNGLVDGAGQKGLTLNVKGLSFSVNGFLCIGDYFTVNEELKMLTSDVNTDSSGNATFHFVPAIHNSPQDGADVNVLSPTLIARVTDPAAGRWTISPGEIYAATLAFTEYIVKVDDVLTILGEPITFGGETIVW